MPRHLPEVYRKGMTDDQIRAFYEKHAPGMSDEEIQFTFGNPPYAWAQQAGHRDRNYADFDDPTAYRDDRGYIFTFNTQDGFRVLNYKIPLALTRDANKGKREQPEYIQPGEVFEIRKDGHALRVYVAANITSRKGRHASGTLEYQIL